LNCNSLIDLIEIYLETRFIYIRSAESWNFVKYNFTKKFPNCA
jgi:hypothetical protein